MSSEGRDGGGDAGVEEIGGRKRGEGKGIKSGFRGREVTSK